LHANDGERNTKLILDSQEGEDINWFGAQSPWNEEATSLMSLLHGVIQ
jgi:hypothetical protein